MDNEATYDIIFAGGGTCGCLIPGRLAAADRNLKILIIEAGEHTLNKPDHTQPARYITHLRPESKTVSFNISKPNENLNGRSMVTASGRCLGGGSSVNFSMYNRGAASDYDDWEVKFGNPGWGSKDLIPLLKKMETYQVKENEPTHGYSGPLKVSYGGTYTNVGKQFLEVAALYDKERKLTDDPNALFGCNAYGRWQKFIDAKTGRRSDVPHHYIYNAQGDNKNIHILTGKKVKRVIFEGERAVGVEYVNDMISNPGSDQSISVARANRLVVISAGACGSSLILERSGIGNPNVLKKHGVDVKVDLPGVGENYQDHQVVFTPYLASEDADTLDGLFWGDKSVEEEQSKLYEDGKGLIAHNGFDAGVKMRPTEKELEMLGPAFKSRWDSFFAHSPDKPVLWLGPGATFIGDHSVAPYRKYFVIGYYTEYPESMGYVHISSGDNANAPPEFDTGFLSRPGDVAILQWGYKKAREFARRLGVYRGEYLPGNPLFSDGSEAKCDNERNPVDVGAPDIWYSAEDEQIIEQYNRQFVQTAWHSLGTCAMKPRYEGGVVDHRLNVYGVKGLKIADVSVACFMHPLISLFIPFQMSIAPQNVGANTYSTALLIGEKAATIIAAELGITAFST